MTAVASKRNARVEARCTPEQRELIERAAGILGRSKTDFIVSALQEASMKTIREFETMELNAKDSSALADALLNPQAPGETLRAAAERYIRATS
jgi:uncharacterized protein (DUF1778 family)